MGKHLPYPRMLGWHFQGWDLHPLSKEFPPKIPSQPEQSLGLAKLTAEQSKAPGGICLQPAQGSVTCTQTCREVKE